MLAQPETSTKRRTASQGVSVCEGRAAMAMALRMSKACAAIANIALKRQRVSADQTDVHADIQAFPLTVGGERRQSFAPRQRQARAITQR